MARTEQGAVAQAKRERAEAVKLGCTEYLWRTAMDGDVCPRCADNADGRFRYDDPPPGGHPGEKPGCRCYAEPILPKSLGGPMKRRKATSPKMPLALKILIIGSILFAMGSLLFKQ